MLKAILFDFGGTLDSDGGHWVDRFRAAYEAVEIRVEAEVFNPAFFESDRRILAEYDMRGKSLTDLLSVQVELIHEILNFSGGKEDRAAAEIVKRFEVKTGKYLRRNCEILNRLSKTYRLGLVSNFTGNLDVICRDYGLAKFFSVILDSFVVGAGKPDPAIFRLALERTGAEAGEAVFVGDNFDRDIKPAKALGMRTVWLRDSSNPRPPDAPEADRVIASLTELEDVL